MRYYDTIINFHCSQCLQLNSLFVGDSFFTNHSFAIRSICLEFNLIWSFRDDICLRYLYSQVRSIRDVASTSGLKAPFRWIISGRMFSCIEQSLEKSDCCHTALMIVNVQVLKMNVRRACVFNASLLLLNVVRELTQDIEDNTDPRSSGASVKVCFPMSFCTRGYE